MPGGDLEAAARVGRLVQGQIIDLRAISAVGRRDAAMHPAVAARASQGAGGDSGLFVAPIAVTSGTVMIVTQTCDLQSRATEGGWVLAHVAPVVEDLDDETLADVVAGRTSRYVAVPWVSPTAVADLAQTGLVDRGVLAQAEPGPVPTEVHRRSLAHALGRIFERAALPDDVVRVLKPLRRLAVEASHPDVRVVFDDALVEIRVMPDIDYGSAEPVQLTVFLLVQSDWYPDQDPAQFRTTGQHPQDIATPLVEAFRSGDERRAGELVELWGRFGAHLQDRMQQLCDKNAQWKIGSVSVRVQAELTPVEYANSDRLDLTYLSLEPLVDGDNEVIDEQDPI